MAEAPGPGAEEMPSRSRIWFLRGASIFENQTDSGFMSADTRAQMITFERGDVLAVAEDSQRCIFIIVEGQLKLRSTLEGGKEIILDVLGPDDTFGPIDQVVESNIAAGQAAGDPPPVALKGPSALPSEAVALTSGSALKFSLEDFCYLVQRRPTLVVNLTRILGLRQKRLEFRLSRLLYRSGLGKVAGLLAELGERYGTPCEPEPRTGRAPSSQAVCIHIRLTHKEMASIVGLKRETVSECLADLEYRGLVSVTRGLITLHDPAKLDSIV